MADESRAPTGTVATLDLQPGLAPGTGGGATVLVTAAKRDAIENTGTPGPQAVLIFRTATARANCLTVTPSLLMSVDACLIGRYTVSLLITPPPPVGGGGGGACLSSVGRRGSAFR